MFWRLSLTYGLLVAAAAAVLGLFILQRAESQQRAQLKAERLAVAQLLADEARRNPDLTAEQLVESVEVPPEQLDARMADLRRLVWSAVAFTAVAAVVPALILVRRVTQPLRELTEGVRRLAEGGFGHKVIATGGDEVGTLARTFNEMSERLAKQFYQLEEDREQLRAILDGMVEGVVAIDARQRVLFTNERAADLLGFNLASAVGRRLWEVVRQRSVYQLVEKALAGGGPQREEIDWHGSSQKFLTIFVAKLGGDHAPGAILVVHDTSELRRLERLRQDFVANVSHELKTPLSVIKVYVETLQSGAADDPEHRGPFLDQIAEQADRLHNLILDLLSLARIESGGAALEPQAVGLDAAVGDCLERHRARADAKHLRLETLAPPPSTPGGEPMAAWADPEAVGTILDNLIDNAIKYTPEGGSIRVSWAGDGGEVRLRVEDTGIGIPERDLPRVFERFYRVDKARSRELGGTGLGLSIVKHLCQAMDGKVAVESVVGRGTAFTIHLPRASAI
jgi:two-component system phosphate regulon sensor histidine kinase PhoR